MGSTVTSRQDDERLLRALQLSEQGCSSVQIARELGRKPDFWRAAMRRVRKTYEQSS